MRKLTMLLLFLGVGMLGCSKDFAPVTPAGWQKEDPGAYGLDSDKLAAAVTAGQRLGYLNALLVWRNGHLVVEKYYNGFAAGDAHNVHSVSKSILSILIGLARDQGLLDLEQKAATFFPEYDDDITDARVRQITLRQLLGMTGGFGTDEELYRTLVTSNNWVRATLALPLKNAPGTRFSYLTFSSHLLSAILTRAAEMNTLSWARVQLLNPLGMNCQGWTRDPQGIYFGGNDMYFAPRDLLIFGQACLQHGLWNGQQVFSGSWLDETWQMRIGGTGDWGALKKVGYGYHWWMGQLNGWNVKLAIGHGGQFIVIIPDLEMIVVTVSRPPYGGDLWEVADQQERAVLQVVSDNVVGAVK